MGCDIHLCVERKVAGKWQCVDRFTTEKDGLESYINHEGAYEPGRNYNLFAILANVRNGRGFAGIKTGEGFNPISDPRGLPKDVSSPVKLLSDQWNGDGHSHSWLSVAEIMAFDWTQKTKLTGVLNGPEYADWCRWRKPEGRGPASYCSALISQSVTEINQDEMEKCVQDANQRWVVRDKSSLDHDYDAFMRNSIGNLICQVEWEQSYYLCAQEFLSEILPKLWRLGAPEKVRIVFWFDN